MRYLFLFLCLVPWSVDAATVTFDPQDSSAGVGTPFVIGINVSSEEYLNALEIVLPIPASLQPIDVSDGNSVLLLWIEEPSFSEETRLLRFSGMVPNGFAGEEGRLITLTVIPHTPGTVELSPTSDSRAYAGKGETIPLLFEPLILRVVHGKENIPVSVPDSAPPEIFEPIVVEDPNLARGRAVLVFSTTDKGSGIARYEVKESWFGDVFPKFGWHEAESPYVLSDQWRGSTVLVRAVDKASNSFTATVAPKRLPLAFYVAPLVLALVLLFFYVRRTRVPS